MPIELDHLILAVNDRDETVAFYTDVLGLTYEGEVPPFDVLRVTEHLTLQVAPWGTSGGEHLAFALTRRMAETLFIWLIRSVSFVWEKKGDRLHF